MKFERTHLAVMSATRLNCNDEELASIAEAAINDCLGRDGTKRIETLRVCRRNGQWTAGWWADWNTPSIAHGDLGFTGETPEDAVKDLLRHVFARGPLPPPDGGEE